MSHNYFTIKKMLGLNLSPLFHATDFESAQKILSSGLKPGRSVDDLKAISFSRSLDFYNKDNSAQSHTWNKQDVIFIFDEKEIKSRFKLVPWNYHQHMLTTNKFYRVQDFYNINKNINEFETRIICTKAIPSKYIKACIVTVAKELETDLPVLYKSGDSYSFGLKNSLDISDLELVKDIESEVNAGYKVRRSDVINALAEGKDLDVIKYLCSFITPCEEVRGSNLLNIAIKTKASRPIIDFFISEGCDVSKSALYAYLSKNPSLYKHLVSLGADPNPIFNTEPLLNHLEKYEQSEWIKILHASIK